MVHQTPLKTSPENRISQGDLYRNVRFIDEIREEGGVLEIEGIEFPLVVVLSQDCDLLQHQRWSAGEHANAGNSLLSALVAPVYNFEHVIRGEHLSELNRTTENMGATSKSKVKLLRQNQSPRYHYLEFVPEAPIVPSVIDFKHYFSVSLDHLRRTRPSGFVGQVDLLHREAISTRFAAFLARIGLPDME